MTRSGTVQFEILRCDASKGEQPRFQTYQVKPAAKSSVLEALLTIQNEYDPSLAFRYACRGAVCGSCAMSINGKLNLACRVQLEDIPGGRVVLEPLPHLEILKDLAVDMDPFWEKYERVRPWLQERIDESRQGRMSEAESKKTDEFVNCILCGLCYGACPVLATDGQFAGPAALAKLYRFASDSREDPAARSLEEEDSRQGIWGCRSVTRCIDVCPKSVRPTDGIAGLKRTLLSRKFKQILAHQPRGARFLRAQQDPAASVSSFPSLPPSPSSIDRRRFLCGMIGGGATAMALGAAIPMVAYVGNLREEPPPPFLAIPEAEVDLPAGKSKLIMYGRLPVLLIKTPEGVLRAFVATCTHFDCIVGYRENENRIFCACHEGFYDVEGNVTAGPPPRPLRRFHCHVQDGKLFLSLERENLEKALRTTDA